MNKVKIIGAGLYGCIIARVLADNNIPVTIYESRNKIGGNCSTYFHDGIEVHEYGSHIFHTDNEDVWNYINRFTEFNNYRHHVIAEHKAETYFLPFNLSLVNQFFKCAFSPTEAKSYINKLCLETNINEPKNLEEQACKLIGRPLYEAFVKNYTAKQWNTDPKNLSPDIIKRLPIRYNYNIEYFNDKFQGIPLYGYQTMFEALIKHDLINVVLNYEYSYDDLCKDAKDEKTIVIYTGALDKLFKYSLGELQWRSLSFETKSLSYNDFQGNACVNYVDDYVKYTRIHEFKHYHPETFDKICNYTIIQYEYPTDWKVGMECYYPVNNNETALLYNAYQKLATQYKCLYVGGRLGMYKYFDMDDTIAAALDFSKTLLKQ